MSLLLSLAALFFLLSSSVSSSSIVGDHQPDISCDPSYPGHYCLLNTETPLPFNLASSRLRVAGKFRTDTDAIISATVDFGHMCDDAYPQAVFYPSSPEDVAELVRFSYSSPQPFHIAARGNGHSTEGQASARGGVVVAMRSLAMQAGGPSRINVSTSGPFPYVDAGGEQLWMEVLEETLKHGLAPRSWTDYMYPTLGGTLSQAGISGHVIRYGPQVSNVLEMDVITGTGETVTCSKQRNSDLYYGVLGGMGQFGIITRARIPLEPAPTHFHSAFLPYLNAAEFMEDMERLVSADDESLQHDDLRLPFIEGIVMYRQELLKAFNLEEGPVYLLQIAFRSTEETEESVLKEAKKMMDGLRYLRAGGQAAGLVKETYVEFLTRVDKEEAAWKAFGEWDSPHPWLDLFVPMSKVKAFEEKVMKGLLRNTPVRERDVILFYPMNRTRWDEKFTVLTPEEETFYAFGLFRHAEGEGQLKRFHEDNEKITRACEGCALYLPHYPGQAGWEKHFGPKRWNQLLNLKKKYDPKFLLAPGSKVFTSAAAASYSSSY